MARLECRSGVGIESSIVVQNVNELQFVAYSDLVIVRIVGGSDFDGSGSKLHIDNNIIGNNGNSPVDEWMLGKLAMEMLGSGKVRGKRQHEKLFHLVPRILWVNSDCGISEHCLRTSRGDNDLFV